ncbi:MAG: hypothetical protein WC659_03355 [Patescibacteria group bacterium]
MSLRTSVPLTEQLIGFLSGLEDMFDFPRSMRQVVYKHEYEHYKLIRRRSAAIRRERERVRKALWNLEKADLITMIHGKKGAEQYRLTPKGWLKFGLVYSPKLKKAIPSKSIDTIKEGSYVVIFDIPEKYRRFRDVLRNILLNIGCKPLQKSIFLTTDKDTIRFVARIIANCELEDRVKILLVKSIL